MIEQVIKYLGGQARLEELACMLHKPQEAVYIIVQEDGGYKVISRDRMEFNSRLCGYDFYSQLVSINKPIASKRIMSNNYYTFFCKKEVKMEEIEGYYNALELPENLKHYKLWVIKNLPELRVTYKNQYIKIFFPGTREEYRERGMDYFYKKSISVTKYDKELGTPMGFIVNSKKPYMVNRQNVYLVDNQKGLEIKFFYDILKALAKRGKDIVYVWDGGIYATSKKDGPPPFDVDGVFIRTGYNARGGLEIKDSDIIAFRARLDGTRVHPPKTVIII